MTSGTNLRLVERPVIDESQREDLLAAAGTLRGHYRSADQSHTVRKSAWWQAFIAASLDSKLPRPHLLRLKWSQIAPNGTVVIRIEGEPVPIVKSFSATTLALFKEIKTPRPRVFEGPSAKHLSGNWKKIVRTARIEGRLPRCNPNVPHFVPAPLEVVPDGGQPQTLSAFLESVYAPLKLGSRSTRTLELYRFSIRNFGRFLGRETLLTDLNDMTVSKLLAWMRARKLSPHSVRKERDQLLAMWRFACQRHLVRDFPNVLAERVPRRAPEAWLKHEVLKLFDAIKTITGTVGEIPARNFWRALLLAIWITGERITAVLQLQWADVDLENGWLIVRAEYRKGKGEDKVSSIPEYARAAFRSIQHPTRDAMFPWPFAPTYIWPKFGVILKKAGLPSDARSKFHRIRRTVASYFEQAGGNSTALLGHSARSVTEKHYLDVRVVKQLQPADLLFNPSAPTPTPTS